MYYLDQYLRDIYTLFKSRRLKGKCQMYFFYHLLCVKNLVGKLFGTKFTSQKFKHLNFHFDNFNAFFAIFTEIFIYNIYYFETPKKNPRVVDCGANIGMAVMYFKYLYPDAVIDCYEPDKATFKILEKNIAANNFKDITAFNEAVSGEVGELEFYSLGDMEGGPGNSLEKSQATFTNTNVYKVPVTTLSSHNYEHIDFLKIDIEGSEGKVFEDMEKTGLIKRVDHLSLEYHYDEALENNKLSDIMHILEKNDKRVIINANTLVTIYVDEHIFKSWDNRYVLMLDAYPKI
ncbi:FkbM family methyltransferase [Candidatus Gracilibacteria bacterium]|nr:FkbM family methyltransferase [Candidatus Gracilibacteria bacterium]